ncbi:AAA family ATPase [Metallosphaera hakonensis]|uniref:AAA family ATPase n=1 Tax=Metallosphaera hakonensis TaxID=79601 RepID=UPI000AE3B4A2|nr:ATP-binding protein [Metallosphaera hakonensis]
MVVIDEFQFLRLGEQNFPGLFHLIRSKWQFHGNVEYVVSGSSVGMLERLFSSREESFYQFFFPIYVNPFSRETSLDFLRRGFEDEGVRYEAESLKSVVEELDGIPAWLNYFGLKALGCGKVNDPCVRRVLEEMLVDPMVVNIVREEYNKLSGNARKVIKFLAEKGGRGDLRGINLGKSSLNEGIRKLINDGYMKREERGIYSLTDPLMAKVLKVL